MNYLETLLKKSGFNFFFLVVDKFLDINLPQLPNFKTLSQENLTIKNSGFLLSQKNIQDQIKSAPNPVIIPFKPSAKIEILCQKNNWLLAANPAKTNRLLEDKIKFFDLCTQENIPIVPGFTAPFSKSSFEEAQQKYGHSLITQTHFGWAGNSTHNFDNYESAQKIIPKDSLTKFSPYLTGYSLLNNCCLTRHGLLQSPPALQFTGLKEFTQNPFATVGRQWPSTAPPIFKKKLKLLPLNFQIKF